LHVMYPSLAARHLHELIACLRVAIPRMEHTLDKTTRDESSKIKILKPANKPRSAFLASHLPQCRRCA
jgi:hypothetical protein